MGHDVRNMSESMYAAYKLGFEKGVEVGRKQMRDELIPIMEKQSSALEKSIEALEALGGSEDAA